jgi:hypothetical protein
LTDFKLVWAEEMTDTVEHNPFLGESSRTERNTLVGKLGDFEYGLIQRENDLDLHLQLVEGKTTPVGEMGCVSQALYRALAFIHGRHCWPQWERINEGSESVSEYTTAPCSVSENIHTPLTTTTCENGDATLLIDKAVECFLRKDAFSEAFDNYLFLTREAAARDTPKHVGTLGICAVLEGFVGFLFDHLLLKNDPATAQQFEAVRSSLVAFAKEGAAGSGVAADMATPWNRFIGFLQSARLLRPIDKYNLLVDHLKLPKDKMSLALDAWKKHRHPLAHGASPKDDQMDQMFATSRVAGAINVLAAATLGYSGLMVLSRIEDQYIRLPQKTA